MKKKSTKSNLDQFNAERSAPVIPLLENELRLCKKRHLEFTTIGTLASYLSDRVPAHRVTLLRNGEYRKRLAAYLVRQSGAVSMLPDNTTDPAVLQGKLAAARTEIGNLTAKLKASNAELQALTGSSHVVSDAANIDFVNLAMALVCVLNRFSEFIHLDRNLRELHDLSAKPSERVVAGRARIGSFVQWMEANQVLPDIAAVLRMKN